MTDKAKRLISKIRKFQKSMQMEEAMPYLQELNMYMDSQSEKEKKEIGSEISKILDEDLTKLKSILTAYKEREKATVITVDNVRYDMREWCTIAQYAKILGYKSTEAISNKIRRGKIPEHLIIYIPELDVKLIKIANTI